MKIKYLNGNLLCGIILLITILIMVGFAPILSTHDPIEQSAENRLQPPTTDNLLGTDRYGRDIFSRCLYAGQVTLFSSFITLSISVFIGIAIGIITGMNSGKFIDVFFMRIIDVLIAFPFMILAMMVAALFGTGLYSLLFLVICVRWVPFTRLTRSIVMHIKHETVIEAATIIGADKLTIMRKYIFPRTIGQVSVQAAFELGSLILTLSALSFLGLGAQPPTAEWGSMMSDGRAHFMDYPHVLLGPAIFVALTVLALNLIGEGLRDKIDPYESIKI